MPIKNGGVKKMKLVKLGMGALLIASMVVSAGIEAQSGSADIIIVGRGQGNGNANGIGNGNGHGNGNGKGIEVIQKQPKDKFQDELDKLQDRIREKVEHPGRGPVERCKNEDEIEGVGKELKELLGEWHKNKGLLKNLRKYPIVTGEVDVVDGNVFTILGGNVIVDASMAMIGAPCWRREAIASATPEVDAFLVMEGDQVYIRGTLNEDGSIAARYVKVLLPESDGILTGIVDFVSEDGASFSLLGEEILLSDASIVLKACGCERTDVMLGDTVRAHVNVEDLDGDGIATDLVATFVRVLPPIGGGPDKDKDKDDDDDDDDDDDIIVEIEIEG